MDYYTLPQVPNQRFEIQINGMLVEFRTHLFRGLLHCSVFIGGECVSSTQPVIGMEDLLPKNVAQAIGGNFCFMSAEGSYVDYTKISTAANHFRFTPFSGEE